MNVLIIGAGGQGALADVIGSGNEHKVISFAHAFKEIGARIAFCDMDTNKSIAAANFWGAEWIFFNDTEQYKFDIIVVATPDDTHCDVLKTVAKLSPKLVICEKPLCGNAYQASEIIKLYFYANIPILVNYTRRFIPELIELKKRYQNGDFGEVWRTTCLFNRGLLHTGSHAIDFMNWFFEGGKGLTKLEEAKTHEDYRIWQIQLFFEKYFWQEQRIFNMPVPSYYDFSTRYVVQNAVNYLKDKEALLCTMHDALKVLEIIERC